MTIYILDVLLSRFGTKSGKQPVCCSTSSSNYCFLTCIQISQEAGEVVWYFHLFKNFPQFFVIHTVKGFGIVKKPEIDVFLEFSCFFEDPINFGNLISAFSNSLIAELVKNLPAMWETWVQSLGWEDFPGEGKGYPLQYSGLENSMDNAWGCKGLNMTEWLSLSLF